MCYAINVRILFCDSIGVLILQSRNSILQSGAKRQTVESLGSEKMNLKNRGGKLDMFRTSLKFIVSIPFLRYLCSLLQGQYCILSIAFI
jgi:hypothetical protein